MKRRHTNSSEPPSWRTVMLMVVLAVTVDGLLGGCLGAAARPPLGRTVATPISEVVVPPGVDPDALLETDDPRAHMELADALNELLEAAPPPTRLNPGALPQVGPEERREAVRLYVQGRQAAVEGKHLIAADRFQSSLELDPTSTATMRALGRSYLILGSIPQALSLFRQVMMLDPDDGEARLTIAIAAADRRAFEAVVWSVGPRWQAIPSGPRFDHDPAADVVASYVLAFSLRNLGYDRAAIEVAREAVDFLAPFGSGTMYGARLGVIYRQRGETWRAMGDAHCRLGDHEAALQAYAEAAALPSPDPGSLLPRVVYVDLKLGRVASSHFQLLDSLQASPGRVSDLEIRLSEYLARHAAPVDELAEAVTDLYRAHSDEPNLARAAAALLPAAEAQTLLAEFLGRRPRDVEVVSQLLTWMNQSDSAAAMALAADLIAKHPDLTESYISQLTALPVSPAHLIDAARELAATPARDNLIARLQITLEAVGQAWHTCLAARQRWPDDVQLKLLEVELVSRLGEQALLEPAIERIADLPGAWPLVVAADAQLRLADPLAALDLAERALQVDRDNWPALIVTARAQVTLAKAATDESEVARWADRAMATAERALSVRPEASEPYLLFVELLREGGPLGNPDQMRAVRRRLRETDPNSRIEATLTAQDALRQGRFEVARERLINLYETDPTDRGSLAMAVVTWVRQDRMEDAMRWLEEQRRSRPGDLALLESWVEVALQSDAADDAVTTLRVIIDAEPENMVAWRLLETSYAAQGEIERSIELAEERMLARPIGTTRQLALAAVFAQAPTADRSVEYLNWVLDHGDSLSLDYLLSGLTIATNLDRSDPRVPELTLRFAERAIGEYPETPLRVYGAALAALAKMGPLDDRFDAVAESGLGAPRAAEPDIIAALQWRRLAQDLVDADHPDAAARLVRARLAAVAPMDADALIQLTLVAIAADAAAGGRVDETISLLRGLDARGQLPGLDGSPEPATLVGALFEASTVYTIVGDESGAGQLLEAVVTMQDDHGMALNNLGYMRLESGATGVDPRVEEWIVRANELEPEDSNVLDTLGWLRYKQGQFLDRAADDGTEVAGAISLIQAAINRDPDPSGEVFDHLGDALYRTGNTERALDAWRRGIVALDDRETELRIVRNLQLLQARVWRLVVADAQSIYDRDYGEVLRRLRAKVDALAQGAEPPLSPTFAELN